MKFSFKNLSRTVVAAVSTLAAAAVISFAGGFAWSSQAKAESQPNYEVTFRVNDVKATPVKEVPSVKKGDTVHVYITVFNPDEDNDIDKLQVYAPFSHRGIFAWIKADDESRLALSYEPKIKLTNDQHLTYVAKSTKKATNQSGELVVTDVDDVSPGQSRLFSDSSSTSKGLYWENVTGGKNKKDEDVQYLTKYELKVEDGNPAVFNDHSSDAETFMVRRKGDSEWKTSLEGFKDGDKLEFRVYVHNTTRGTMALNTKVGIENWPSGDAKQREITGFVDADNADRAKSSVSLKDDKSFKLDYKEKSTRFMGRPTLKQGFLLTDMVRPEGIITTGGISIGEGDVGSVDGCFDFVVYAFFEAEVKEDDDHHDDDDACFEIRVWEDFNGNGRKDAGEPGLDWDSEWQYENDSTWTSYKNYASKDGKGSKICSSKERKTRTRLVVKDWCKPTTVTNREDTLDFDETKLFEFGCRREKAGPQKGGTPTQLPRTGTAGEILLGTSAGLLALGTGLTLLRRRLQN